MGPDIPTQDGTAFSGGFAGALQIRMFQAWKQGPQSQVLARTAVVIEAAHEVLLREGSGSGQGREILHPPCITLLQCSWPFSRRCAPSLSVLDSVVVSKAGRYDSINNKRKCENTPPAVLKQVT